MYLLIILIPLISTCVIIFFGRFLGKFGVSIFICVWMFICSFFSWLGLFEIGFFGSINYFKSVNWISSYMLNVCWGFLFDSVSIVIIVIVTTISSLVYLYSTSYMKYDPHIIRFLTYLMAFSFFMIVLVSSNNLVQLFVGWEGVGLVSYLLINFWFTRLNANQAAIKALLVNRIGDFSLLLGIFTIFYIFQSVDYSIIFSIVPYMDSQNFLFFQKKLNGLNLIAILLFIGACSKSAQFGLHTWLKDAMEGPTPVSALLHSSTMVLAGVYLILRFSPFLEFAPKGLFIITFFGAITCIYAATSGIFQNDIKKIIAYSTCSQLGYMVLACGISNYNVAIYHLFNHSWFKALLFLCAGSVIHALGNEQDLRKMGSLIQLLPFTYSMMLIGTFALIGFPFLTGFYSKDFIIELVLILKYSLAENYDKSFAYWFSCFAVFCTSFYSFKLLFFTFINKSNSSRIKIKNVHEGSFFLKAPLFILSVCSIFFGFLFKDLFIGIGSNFWGLSLFMLPNYLNWIEAEENLILSLKLVPLTLTILGFFLIFCTNFLVVNFIISIKLFKINRWVITFFTKQWYFDQIYNFLVIFLLNIGYKVTFKIIDRGFLEIFGPEGLLRSIPKWAYTFCNFQLGYFIHYIFIIIFSIVLFSLINFLKIFLFTHSFLIWKIILLFLLSFISLYTL
uniref:NADH dehydrogenase subunit 5 n=1 Tax=Dixoniella grisea TaxID=35153 RepID=UPI001FCD8E12|nr:NADH dehydrogenase subunit 5 [Dixoniella grisea]UNJ18982.1 NADH dehydrogenase subunit 5 [Dixoniella grisea]